MASFDSAPRIIGRELVAHAPFTIFGALAGIAVMVIVVAADVPQSSSEWLFEGFHSAHVFLSALATAGMYRLYGKGKPWATIVIGYVGSIGIATVSDCLIPYLGESLLGLKDADPHVGFLEAPLLVNSLALAGVAVAFLWPKSKFPHAGHVLLSTGASLFHVTMAVGEQISAITWIVVFVFIFLSVWLPCCVSDIVFPLLFCKEGVEAHKTHRCSCRSK
ncbi:MAG: hypothetical protein ACYSWU_09145 [Planctomycetota bacterium]|jgi:hypothetical protein